MATLSVRTTTHSYPKEEMDAMLSFYAGKNCVITRQTQSAVWAHILDAALGVSNLRLTHMLNRNLRVDRHPRRAAEVRENVVPMNAHHQLSMDLRLAESTLFLHEDIIIRTLLYERQLQEWRKAEISAGRGDPGRPAYETVFGGVSTTSHRYHVTCDFPAFLRFQADGSAVTYTKVDCPGIYNPSSQRHFPVIETLLSIPFSLLHTLPRLTALIPFSAYRHKLIDCATEIIRLWWWDPTPKMIADFEKVTVGQKRKHQSMQRNPGPEPISLRTTRFADLLQPQTGPSSTAKSSKRTPQCAVELPSAQTGTMCLVSLYRDELLLASADKGSAQPANSNKGLVANSQVTCASEETAQGAEDLDETKNIERFDVISWSEKVVNCGPKPLPPLTPSPFERGVLGGLSVNDILMIKGLIHPLVYIDFIDPSSFSLS